MELYNHLCNVCIYIEDRALFSALDLTELSDLLLAPSMMLLR